MILSQLLLALFVVIPREVPPDTIAYRSPTIHLKGLTQVANGFSIVGDDGARISIEEMSDAAGLLYWYRRVKTGVCQTGECKLVDVGLYWDCTGDFFGLDVYGEHLTKTDHSVFSNDDYAMLINVLQNDWSLLREYKFEELTVDQTKGDLVEGRTDAVSSATRREVASEAVENAVYTTYTLWHLVHDGEKEQLMDLTIQKLNAGPLIDRMIAAAVDKYTLFLLELFSQSRIQHHDKLRPLIMRGLREKDNLHFQHLALKSLSQLEVDSDDTQKLIAEAYRGAPVEVRLRIIDGLHRVRYISSELYHALQGDVDSENEWIAGKVLTVLMHASDHTPEVLAAAEKLQKSENAYVRKIAEAFVDSIKR